MPTGKILFVHTNEAGASYGFIAPDDGSGMREENVWFGELAMIDPRTRVSQFFENGDRVEYDQGNYRPGKGPTAKRVKPIDDENSITTIRGEFDVA